MALKRTKSVLITLDDGVKEYLSHVQSRKIALSHMLISGLFHKRKMIQEYSH